MKYSLDIDVTIDGEWIYTECGGCINVDNAFDALVSVVNALDGFEYSGGNELSIKVTKFEEEEE